MSLSQLLKGDRLPVTGRTTTALKGYVKEIVRPSFPAFRSLAGRLLRAQLDGYLDGIVDHDFEEIRNAAAGPPAARL